jgi:hypothetical protein
VHSGIAVLLRLLVLNPVGVVGATLPGLQ